MNKQKYPQVETSTITEKPTRSNKRGNYSSAKRDAKQDRKRAEAFVRNEKYERLSLSDQLKSCVPNGSKRQRARIEKAMAKAMEKNPLSIKAETPTVTPAVTKSKAKKSFGKNSILMYLIAGGILGNSY